MCNKKMSLILVFVIMLLIFTGCSRESKKAEKLVYGAQLAVTAVCEGEEEGSDSRANNMVDGYGMSGKEGPFQTHDNKKGRGMWLSGNNPGDKNVILFEFEQVEPIGKVFIWNYNEKENQNPGLKNIKIYYSADGESFQELKGKGYPYVLAKADGSKQLEPTNLNDGKNTPIDFEGVCVKYVKIVPDTRVDIGNWGSYSEGESRFGLSEVRFYRYKNKAVYGKNLISEAAAGSYTVDSYPGNTVNGYGMSGTDKIGDKHDNDEKTMWLTQAAPGENNWIMFDLDGTYPIKEMAVWNFNQKGQEQAGLKDVKIMYSINKTDWTELKGEGYPYRFEKAGGLENQKATNLAENHSTVDFGNVSARYIKIIPQEGVNKGNWGYYKEKEVRYGLSEVRFYAGEGIVSEPAREWTGLMSNYIGWLGADGIFSIPLNGDDSIGSAGDTSRTMFIFSDTYIGSANILKGSMVSFGFKNHTVALLDGKVPYTNQYTQILDNKVGSNIFEYKCWLEDGIAIDDKVHIISFIPDDQWNPIQADLLTIPLADGKPDLENFTKQSNVPLYYRDEKQILLFGAGILDNTLQAKAPDPDGYVYVYGWVQDWSAGVKKLVVSRVKREEYSDMSKWRYWDGEKWEDKITAALKPEAVISEGHISCELSVTPMTTGKYKDKYMLIYTKDVMSKELEYCIGDTPYGPFENPVPLYYCEDNILNEDAGNVYNYNAKAHPHISPEGELLVTYNSNAVDSITQLMNVEALHPRWIRIYEVSK
ncbi:MAG: discoidin domain-containing protein [Mobilitalea sp.]